MPDLPEYILICFENYFGPTLNGSVPIRKSSKSWMNGAVRVNRIQFAIQPAYASTIHKAQGLTISKMVIDLTPQSWAPNLSYTGIIRVKKLEDMLISNLPSLSDLNKIVNNQKFEMKQEFLRKIELNEFQNI